MILPQGWGAPSRWRGGRGEVCLRTAEDGLLKDDDSGAVAGFVLDGFEGAVGVVEREGLDGGGKLEIAGEGEEIARILARHVGDAAHLALAPEQAVVVEGGHLVEMNGVDGDDAALAQGGERADDDLAAGAKVMARSSSTGGLASSSPTHVAPSAAAALRCDSPRVTT